MPPKVAQMIREQEEQKILKEFKKIGYESQSSPKNEKEFSMLSLNALIVINKKTKEYIKVNCYSLSEFVPISLKEHQLLHKLFEIWGWFDE